MGPKNSKASPPPPPPSLTYDEAKCYLNRYEDLREMYGPNNYDDYMQVMRRTNRRSKEYKDALNSYNAAVRSYKKTSDHYFSIGIKEGRIKDDNDTYLAIAKKHEAINKVNELDNNIKTANDLINDYIGKLSTINYYTTNLIPNRKNDYERENNNLKSEIERLQREYKRLKGIDDQTLEVLRNNHDKENTVTSGIKTTLTSIYNYLFSKEMVATSIYQNKAKYYARIVGENNYLNNLSNENIDELTTNDVKPEYLKNSRLFLRYLNNVFFGIYYILVFILAYFLYFKSISNIAKFLLILILLLFPFFITNLQDNLRFLYNFIRSLT